MHPVAPIQIKWRLELFWETFALVMGQAADVSTHAERGLRIAGDVSIREDYLMGQQYRRQKSDGPLWPGP